MPSAENQVSEQEMDAVIARSTYQESKEASSSPGSGIIITHLCSACRRASQGALPPAVMLDSLSLSVLAEVVVREIPCFLLAATFDFAVI